MDYQPVTYSLSGLMPGINGTVQTLQEMARLVRRDSKKLDIVSLARSIVKDVKPHDEYGEINAIHEYVKNNLRYVQDPVDVEWIQDAERSLLLGAGDCDDGTDLFATLVAAIGYVPVYALAGYDADPNSQYDHVWVSVRTNDGKWTDADFSEYKPLGWHGSGFAKLGYFPIFEGTPMPGMGYLGQDDGSGDPSFSDSFFTDTSGDGSGSSFDWNSLFGDTGGGTVDPTLDPNFDPNATISSTDWQNVISDPNYFDPTNPVTTSSEDLALFDYLQKNFAYTGTSIDDVSLQSVGIYTGGDGSFVTVNPDGTLSFTNANGSMVGQLVDSNGNPLSAAGQQPSALKQVAQSAAKALSSGTGGGGGGGGIPLGGGGAKPATPTQPASSTASLAQTIASIANSIKSAISGTPLSPYGAYNRINPLTGKPIAGNSLYTSPQGAGLQLNTTTIIIGVLLFMALKK